MATQKNSIKSQPAQSGVAQVMLAQDLHVSVEDSVAVSPRSFSIYVRALMQNWRQGTVASKDRGEVAFSTKKPWKQKGTGRARCGTRRSPLWRKGGTIFGPQERVRTLKVTQAMKKRVMSALFWQNLDAQKIISLNWELSGDVPKTSQAFKMLKDAGLHDKRVILFVAPHDFQTHASFNNLANVRMLLFDQPNARALSDGHCWAFLSKDIESFKNMVSAWI